jgi:hypothetical protein
MSIFLDVSQRVQTMHKRVLGSEDVWSPKGETKPVGKFP